jgi:hypothetical protein
VISRVDQKTKLLDIRKVMSSEASLYGITDALTMFDVDRLTKPAPAMIIATSLRRGRRLPQSGVV